MCKAEGLLLGEKKLHYISHELVWLHPVRFVFTVKAVCVPPSRQTHLPFERMHKTMLDSLRLYMLNLE